MAKPAFVLYFPAGHATHVAFAVTTSDDIDPIGQMIAFEPPGQ